MTSIRYAVLPLFFATAPAWACPLCHTTTAEQVRDGLVSTARDESVWMAVTLPFVAVGAVIYLINKGSRP